MKNKKSFTLYKSSNKQNSKKSSKVASIQKQSKKLSEKNSYTKKQDIVKSNKPHTKTPQQCKTYNPLKPFIQNPSNIKFETQAKNEKVILLLRQHPITLFKKFLIAIIMIIAPKTIFLPLFSIPILANSQTQITIIWYLITMGFISETFLSWFFSVNIVTNKRLVDIDFFNITQKRVSTIKLDSIEDISINANGFFASIFNFGTIYIQTAADDDNIEFENIPQPAVVNKLINDLYINK